MANSSEDLELITSDGDNMGDAVVRLLMESIQKDLKEVSPLPPNCSIFLVPSPLRKVKPEAYTPRMVSIGPYHHSDEHLQPMEAQKFRYMNDFLARQSQATLGDYVKAMTELEARARCGYAEIVQFKSEFVKMMLMDGCFILELFIRTHLQKMSNLHEPRYRDDPILNATWMSCAIKCDLILLENQLPFFILERLYELFTGDSYSNGLGPLTSIARLFFEDFAPQTQSTIRESSRFHHIFEVAKNVSNFVSIARKVGKTESVETPLLTTVEEHEENSQPRHLLDFVRSLLLQSTSTRPLNPGKFMHTRTATELCEASINFEKGPKTCLLDITFTRGVLKIPTMKIEDWTEPLLRNLIAFEQSRDSYDKYVTAYAAFIDGLIDSPKDVELLQKKGIIVNLLGNPNEVVAMFNSLLKEVSPTAIDGNFYFSSVCHELEKFYKIPLHKWKASLMLNYCNSPWAFISVVAAVFLLILTVTQTICSLLLVL